MVLLYATPDDLPQPPPANADALLRSASITVRHATRAAIYDTDDTGLPTDTTLRDAMRDATVAQVNAWTTLGLDPAAGPAGATGAITARNLGSASLSYAPSSKAANARADTTDSLVAEAERILQAEGLLSTRAWWYG